MSNININDCSKIKETNLFDRYKVKQEKDFLIDPHILLGLSSMVSDESKEPTFSVPEIRARLASLQREKKMHEKYQVTDRSPAGMSLNLVIVKMETGGYSAVQNREELNPQIKPEVSDESVVRIADGIKTFGRLPQKLTDHMTFSRPEFKPYIPRFRKQAMIGKKRRITKRLKKPGPPIPLLGRRFQKRFINVATKKC